MKNYSRFSMFSLLAVMLFLVACDKEPLLTEETDLNADARPESS